MEKVGRLLCNIIHYKIIEKVAVLVGQVPKNSYLVPGAAGVGKNFSSVKSISRKFSGK